ncbi:amidohydrolase [Pistricoccus aurantiacus]|uniref:Amidohydrolase n=1 Tax=Pistricoccus aurantiacus TaxID=1883414 RepID=A0A5B8SVJ2_9GAMM|nr:amidohydrolase [Pistricoccus aurantiacus]QEA38730.1 amidohydrolase [Pistricoccus aurantiacus]
MTTRLPMILGALCLATSAATGAQDTSNADQDGALILHNGKIAISGDNGDYRFAQAVMVQDGKIAAVGDDKTLLNKASESAREIDLDGRTVIPGLNDSHTHAVRGGRFYNLELRWDGVDSLDSALNMISEQAARTPEDQWVRVIGGWSPYQFDEDRMPTPAELTKAAPDTPVFVLFLYSRGFLNKAAVDKLGITENTPAPTGGRYELTDDGGAILWAEPNPTILYQTIGQLPGLSEENQLNSTRQFYRELNRFGLTSVIDAGGGGHTFPMDYSGTRQMAEQGEMPLRVSYYLFPQTPEKELGAFRYWARNFDREQNVADTANGYVLEGGGEFLTWNAGDFENFTAPRPEALEKPYMRQELYEVTRFLAERGWPIRIHATYDQTVSKILDIWEKVDAEHSFNDLRCIIDHVETISDQNIERVKALGCGIAVQSRMAYAGELFEERYGKEAAATAPPLRKLAESDIPVGLGSDATRVATYNPWVTLYWAVTGNTVGGNRIYPPENQLSRAQALRLHTEGSAWFSGEQDVKGRIEPGQYADLAVLSDDYFTVPGEKIKDIESVLTVVDGTIVYGADAYADLAPPLPDVSPDWSPVKRFSGYDEQ